MEYRFLKHNTRHRRGHIVEMSPGAIQTKQLLAAGMIEPVEAPAEKRETKAVTSGKRRKGVSHADK